ncbi:unnamed protein product, partial [Polarella glacialis]
AVKALCQRGLREDALTVVRERIRELRSEDDRRGQMLLASAAVDAMFDCGAAGEALALAEQSLAIIRELGDMCEEAWMLQKLAEVRLARGELTEALLAAQEALALFQAAGDKQGQAAALEALTHVYTAKHEVDKAPNRLQGLSLLSDVAGAVARRDMQGFQEALEQLRRTQGVDDRDLDASLGRLLLQDAAAKDFFTRGVASHFQVSIEEAEALTSGGPVSHLQRAKGYDRAGLYWMFRQSSMGYGPSFRPVQAIYRHGDQYHNGSGTSALSVLKDDTLEDWEQVAFVQAHAGVLDGALQATAIPGAP